MVRVTYHLDMTIAVDWDVKPQSKSNQWSFNLRKLIWKFCEVFKILFFVKFLKLNEKFRENKTRAKWGDNSVIYRTSMARTLMAHSPGLTRTMIMVPTEHFKHNPPRHTGQCKSTGGCYNELVVAYFGTGGGVKWRKR